ncbi:MAG: iron transporter [Lachnospiraceae bacterium]|nr:iron transporter [Lachnospiraceae bacterium]
MKDYNKLSRWILTGLVSVGIILSGCGGSGSASSAATSGSTAASGTSSAGSSAISSAASQSGSESRIDLADGTYEAKFDTDSTMFKVNEANDEKGTLTVKDGVATIHITLAGKSIVNVFYGTSEDAKKEGAKLIEPSTDTVKYSDGETGEALGFDIPVPYLDEEYIVAIVGTKGNWYDHKVKVSEVKPRTEESSSSGSAGSSASSSVALKNGEYKIEFDCTGGSGRGGVEAATVTIKDGKTEVKLTMTSASYSKVVVDGKTYESKPEGGKSTFTIPAVLDSPMEITATTEAMSQPHDIKYIVTLKSSSLPASAAGN